MEKLGFTRDDLSLFGMEPPEARAKAAEERLRPRLEEIAYRMTPALTKFAGRGLNATIHMPGDGGSNDAAIHFRHVGAGFEDKPIFTFSISRGGVHARLIIEREAPGREKVAKLLARAATSLAKEFVDTDLRCYDDWDGRGIPAPATAGKAPFWKDVAERLGRTSGHMDIGVGWPEARATLLSYEDLAPAFRSLVPLYKKLG